MEHEDLRRLMIAVNEIEGACALLSKKIGVKENTLTLLYALDDGLPHSQKEICDQWLLPKTTLNTIVKECVAEGLLVLGEAGSTREKALWLTDKGRAYTARVLPPVYQAEQQAAFGAGLTAELAQTMARFAEIFEEEARNFDSHAQ